MYHGDREETAAMTTKANELINVIDFQIQELRNLSLALENVSSIQFELRIKVSLENILSFLEV